MHKMIIGDERDLEASIVHVREAPTPIVEMVVDESMRFQEFFYQFKKIRDRDAHHALRDALIEYLWEEFSNSES